MNTGDAHNPAGYLIEVTATPELKEALIDWLLAQETEHGFSSFYINGHSSRHDVLSLSEQVAGRQKQSRFQMQLDGDQLVPVLEALKRDFKNSGLHYWVIPVIESGRV